jgi:hypothetical protein
MALELRCRVALESRMIPEDRDLVVIFLESNGPRIPVAMSRREFKDLVALFNREGNVSSQVKEVLEVWKDMNLSVKAIRLVGVDESEIPQLRMDVADVKSGEKVFEDDCDIVEGIFYSVHFGAPICVDRQALNPIFNTEIARYAETLANV